MKKRDWFIIAIILGICLLFASPLTPKKAHAAVNCTVETAKIANDPEELNFLTLINMHRQQNNLPPLQISQTLNKASAWMSKDMVGSGRLDHDDSLGRDAGTRIQNCDYNGNAMGENIATGTPGTIATAAQVFNLWKNSPPHNANMLSTNFKFIGISKEGTTNIFWTTDFGDIAGPDGIGGGGTAPTLPPATITPTTAPSQNTISFSLFLDGVGRSGDRTNPGYTGNTTPFFALRTIVVTIFNVNGTQVAAEQAVVRYDPNFGNFKGSVRRAALPQGNYTIKVKADRYLRKLVPGIITLNPGRENVIPSISLTVGDINGDNNLDISDFSLLLGCYSDFTFAKNCNATNKVLADLNDDTFVNAIDYNLFIRELAVKNGD